MIMGLCHKGWKNCQMDYRGGDKEGIGLSRLKGP